MNTTIKLSDGRSLAYDQYGDMDGKPLLFFHGTPSSRLARYPDDDLTASLGVRLITIDRPGFGLSTYQPNRQLLDWPGDVTALANSLGIERFAVAGISGGGPYVAACAYKIPHRITVAGIISGVGPTDVRENSQSLYKSRRGGVFLARHAPFLLRPLVWLLQNPQRDPEKYFQKMLAQLCESDQTVLNQPKIKDTLKMSWLEGTRNGIRGFVRDAIIFSLPWGFQLEEIHTKVYLWHGDQDTSTPLAMVEFLADRIPDNHLTIIPGGGHGLLYSHWATILRTLTKI